jgi:hypothetical protein
LEKILESDKVLLKTNSIFAKNVDDLLRIERKKNKIDALHKTGIVSLANCAMVKF